MSQQVVIFNNEFSMPSYEFLTTVINPARVEAGENPVDNRKFLARVRDELNDERKTFPTALITPTGGGRQMESITLTRDQLLLVGMRESIDGDNPDVEVSEDDSEWEDF